MNTIGLRGYNNVRCELVVLPLPSPYFFLPFPSPFSPFPPSPLEVGPHCWYGVQSAGPHTLPRRVRAEFGRQMYFLAF